MLWDLDESFGNRELSRASKALTEAPNGVLRDADVWLDSRAIQLSMRRFKDEHHQ